MDQNIHLGKINRKNIEANFTGGDLTSDVGLLALRNVEEKTKFLEGIASVIPENRQQEKIQHSKYSQIIQRVHGLIQGYEDCNDHETLRDDKALQLSCNSEESLSSPSTLCRFENAITMDDCKNIAIKIFEYIIEKEEKAPEEIILDFDSSDIEIYGDQEGKHYHGYYDSYCYLPLYIYWDKKPLLCLLRPSNIDGAKKAFGALKLIIQELKEKWPEVRIILRGDSGFCRDKMIKSLSKKYNIKYIIGIPKNNRLNKLLEETMNKSKEQFKETKIKQQLFTSFQYKAGSWDEERRVIGKAEFGEKGENTRYVITNISGDPKILYKDLYCARGESENRVKEVQMQLFSCRTSCKQMIHNQFRMLLSQMAVVIMEYIRNILLKSCKFAQCSFSTIRNKLLKIGAVIVYNTRRYVFKLPSAFPYKEEAIALFGYISSA